MKNGIKAVIIPLILISTFVPKAVSAQPPSFLTSSDFTNQRNTWLQADKIKHFTCSAAVSYCSFYVYREEFNNTESGSYCFSGGLTLSIGALKEFYDYKHPANHDASWQDFIADAAGAGFGLILAYMTIN